jgi:NADH-quinone oxidoreductase subunit F
MGARGVQIFYRRSIEEMPAWKKDIEEAIEEGVVINPLWAPKRIVHEGRRPTPLPKSLTALFETSDRVMPQGGRVTGIEFARSKTAIDAEGRSYLGIDEETTQLVDAETVIIAIGQAPDASFLSKEGQLERSVWGSLEVNENSLATNIAGIFAGGDFITGPSTVIEAIASGRRAAIAIDKYLQGDRSRIEIVDEKTSMHSVAGLALDEEITEDRPRIQIEMEEAKERVSDFREVEKGFKKDQAHHEAKRCLRCDLEKEITQK